jgi:hypothetical protein
LNWSGWKLVALPIVIKATRKLDSVNAEPRLVVEFLASLVRARKLNVEDVDLVWKEGCERWIVDGRLGLWKRGDDFAVSHFISPEILH